MRVSAGFLVTGLSGNTRIQILPPRLTKRVMATRLASICRSVIQPGSSTFNPKSPKASVLPRQALPVMRPRCCLRYFTFFGINIIKFSVLSSRFSVKNQNLESARYCRLRFAFLGRQNFAFVYPALHADHAIRGARLGEAVVDVGAQRVQRQPALQVPLRARDFVAVQASAYADFDALATKTQRGIYRLAHSPAEADALFQLQRDGFGNQLGIEFGLVHFLDVDKDFARSAFLQFGLELVDFRALASDDDARPRRLDNDAQLVARPLDFDGA